MLISFTSLVLSMFLLKVTNSSSKNLVKILEKVSITFPLFMRFSIFLATKHISMF